MKSFKKSLQLYESDDFDEILKFLIKSSKKSKNNISSIDVILSSRLLELANFTGGEDSVKSYEFALEAMIGKHVDY